MDIRTIPQTSSGYQGTGELPSQLLIAHQSCIQRFYVPIGCGPSSPGTFFVNIEVAMYVSNEQHREIGLQPV